MHGYANDLTSVQHLSFLYTGSKFYRDQRRTYIRVALSKFAFLFELYYFLAPTILILRINLANFHFSIVKYTNYTKHVEVYKVVPSSVTLQMIFCVCD